MDRDDVMFYVEQHYDRLLELGYNVVGVFLYGSQNYKLDYEGSDIDTKAIVLPKLDDIVLNRQPVSTTVQMEDGGLCDVKDIRKMFECFKKQNINFIELLFTDYYILDEEYADIYQLMLDNAESIARYNNYASVNCMAGMALEKLAALDHPYPSIAHKIEEFGYDPKQLHHILRIKDFIVRYCEGEKYKDILIPKDREYLLSVKLGKEHNYEVAKKLAEVSCAFIKQYKTDYMNEHDLVVDKSVEELMNEVASKLIKKSIKEEMLRDV